MNVKIEGALLERVGRRETEIEVEPENWPAVCIYQRLSHQWRTTSVVTARAWALVRTGLDFAAVPMFAGALGVPVDAELLDNLHAMEAEAVRIYGQQAMRSLKGAR